MTNQYTAVRTQIEMPLAVSPGVTSPESLPQTGTIGHHLRALGSRLLGSKPLIVGLKGQQSIVRRQVTDSPASLHRKQKGQTTVRIGAVNYLNSKPLIEGLKELLPDADLRLDYPSRLADSLMRGSLDVALIPSVEYFRGSQYEIVSDACVASNGPVLSVKLYSRVPIPDIRSLALDQGSRTSATLVQILLWERYGVRPRLESLPVVSGTNDTLADAILLIGDRAMVEPSEQFVATWDLGQQWSDWTGLPFVFAMWVARRGVDLSQIEPALITARNQGLQQIENIARREAPLLGLSVEATIAYLTQNLHYTLGSAEQSGLRWFAQLAAQIDLAPQGVELVYRSHSGTR